MDKRLLEVIKQWCSQTESPISKRNYWYQDYDYNSGETGDQLMKKFDFLFGHEGIRFRKRNPAAASDFASQPANEQSDYNHQSERYQPVRLLQSPMDAVGWYTNKPVDSKRMKKNPFKNEGIRFKRHSLVYREPGEGKSNESIDFPKKDLLNSQPAAKKAQTHAHCTVLFFPCELSQEDILPLLLLFAWILQIERILNPIAGRFKKSPFLNEGIRYKKSPFDEEGIRFKKSPFDEEGIRYKKSPFEEEGIRFKKSPFDEEGIRFKKTPFDSEGIRFWALLLTTSALL